MPIFHRVWDNGDEDEDGTATFDDEDPEETSGLEPGFDEEGPRTVFLVLDGDPPDEDDLQGIQRAHLIVAADGAANGLRDDGIGPDVVVGDMDAIDPGVLEALEEDGAEVVRHPTAKDETDGRLALTRALEAHPDHLVIVGAHGGRTPMFLTNLGLLREAAGHVRLAEMRGRGEHLMFLDRDRPFQGDAEPGAPFSLLAWGDDAEVSIAGADFSIDGVLLRADDGRGVSNAAVGGPVQITVHQGLVLLVLEDPDRV